MKPVSRQNDLCIRPVIMIPDSEAKQKDTDILLHYRDCLPPKHAPHERNTISTQLPKFLALSLLRLIRNFNRAKNSHSVEFFPYKEIHSRKPIKNRICKQGVTDTQKS